MSAETFTIVGVSTYGNITKFRVGNGVAAERAKVLVRNGHTKINLVDLENPMTKLQAIDWYKEQHPEFKTLTIPNQAKILKAAKAAHPVNETEIEATEDAEAEDISAKITEDTAA
jgi:hypothetical protein